MSKRELKIKICVSGVPLYEEVVYDITDLSVASINLLQGRVLEELDKAFSVSDEGLESIRRLNTRTVDA
jgi:hypothetical protein